jgi:FixJ family two-component response regulator
MLGGRQIEEMLAATRPEIRVLFISGYSDDTGSDQNCIAPDLPFLQKPFTTTALLQKVREVLDRTPSPEKPS